MIKVNKSKLFFLALFLFLFGACFIFTQGRELEIKYPILPGVEIPATTETVFPVYVKYIFNLAIMIAGIVAFGALVFGGIRYLTSGGSPSTQKDASGQIAAGFFSLIILLSSYLILVTIDPQLVVFRLPEIQKIPSPEITPLSPEKMIYTYKEIPTGYFIDKALEKEKFDKIEDLSKNLEKKVKELKNLAKQLENLTKECRCEGRAVPNPSSCFPGNICPQNIVCQGDFYSSHDPCPNRNQIDRKKEEILKKVEEIRELKNKLEEQKEILMKDLANLQQAEKLMMECFGQPINYDNLVNLKNILNIEVEKIEEWKDLQIPQDEATFYCKK